MFQRVEEFISLSVQWTIENSCSKKTVSIFVPTAVDIQSLVKYLAYNSQIILDVETLSQKFYNLVVVTRENDIQAAVSLMSDNGGFLLARIEGNSWHVNLNMIPVIRQKFGNEEYILFRKTEVKDGRHVPQVLHLNGKYSTWMQQIRGAAPCHRLLAIAKLEEQRLEAISFSVEQARKIPEFEHVRVEDTHVSYLGLNSSLLSESDSESLIEVSKYLNTLDFSGQSKSGQKQMGITAVHHEDKKVISDKLFTWQVPDSWSLQDAATVPVSYTIAYYSLAMAAKWKHGDTVLVTNGCSTIGQAALVLALDYGCTVFTTVADNEENKFIKQIFPQINDSHIFNYEDDSFELRLLKETEGNGVKIVLNCFSGDGFQSSVRCLADHGYLVHIGESKFLSIETCGMYIFLKNRAIFGVSIQNILNLPSESKEALHAGIQDRILRGVIKPLKYSVFNKQQSQLAFRSDADVNRREKVLISSVEDENEAIDLVHDPNSFFIVLGSDIMLNLDMAEWLARQGVRKVAVTLSSNKLPKLIERRVKLLLTYYNTQVIFFKTTAFNCNKSICLLVQNASEELSGPLEGIFVLPVVISFNIVNATEPVDQENGLTSSTVANLDIITRGISTLRYFVCLHMKNSWSICEQRYREGFPALSIFWDQLSQKHFDMKQTLYVLSRLVASKVRNPIIIATEKKLNTGESNRGLYFFLLFICKIIPSPRTFFPTTIQSITRLGEDLVSNSEWLQELPSLSPGYRNIKTISPVFIIPGLQGSASEILKPLLQQLVHPVFCARILQPEKTITDAATILVKVIC
ncbi:hypothetical protein C0J52_04414 [Blattella germanica]|nr:hypothetical protein C0J52_04414 [Blattella germanica]